MSICYTYDYISHCNLTSTWHCDEVIQQHQKLVVCSKKKIFEFQVVVITGASSGIGEALAHAFYEHGSKVVLAARRETELSRVKNDLISKNIVSIS